jgi:hypothetical protein
MPENTIIDGLSLPIMGLGEAACRQAHADALAGSYPLGSFNKSWHGGLHFATEKPIAAIADGEVVAYRFSQETLEVDLENKKYSDSFVLIRHLYKSPLGNRLDFFSLYMHLDPKPMGEFLPSFLAANSYVANGRDLPPSGLMLFKKDKVTDSLRLVPKYAIVERRGDSFDKNSNNYTPIAYTDIDGVVYEGVLRNAATALTESADGTVFVNQAKQSATYGSANTLWECCKNLKGILIYATPTDRAEIIGFIPNSMRVEFENVDGNVGWKQLTSPLPHTAKSESFYIKAAGLKTEISGQPDPARLGALIIPAADERPLVQAGEVIGGAGPFFHEADKKIVHVEVFTLEDLQAAGSILHDPEGERFFATAGRYTIPVGRTKKRAPIRNLSLQAGDTVTVLEEAPGALFVKVQVTGLVRVIKKAWVKDPNLQTLCSPLNQRLYYYTPLPNQLAELQKLFNGWIIATDTIYRLANVGVGSRQVFFPCATVPAAQVWIPCDTLIERDNVNNAKIGHATSWLYPENPIVSPEPTTDTLLTIDNPELLTQGATILARLDDDWQVDSTGITPETAFAWGGFELLSEDPANHDAFMDFANVKSSILLGEEAQETQTGAELEKAIRVAEGEYDIDAIRSDKVWQARLEKLIIKCPSEWHYSDEKYQNLQEKIGGLDQQIVRRLIQSLTFWDDAKAGDAFKEVDESRPWPANAKDGKEIYFFHALSFVKQMSLLFSTGLNQNQRENVFTFLGLIRAAAGDKIADADSVKAIAASLWYRIKSHEWFDAWDFHSLAERHNLSTAGLTDEELHTLIPQVGPIFTGKAWEGLPAGYVLFHAVGQTIESQPWDSTVLDTDNARSVGGFTFYKYRVGAKTFATKLTVKEIKLTGGGDKGASRPCLAGEALSRDENGQVKPYRYEVATSATWNFEFVFNIRQGTPDVEAQKRQLRWELRYYHTVDGKIEQGKVAVAHTTNRFTVQIPRDVSDYSVRLIPFVNGNQPMSEGFVIALKKKEQVVFTGAVIKWVDENGSVVPFEDGAVRINELPAFSGNPDKRGPEFQSAVNEGPIPEGVWWMPRSNLQSYDNLGWWDKTFGRTWPGGVERWGRWRLWLEADSATDTKHRSNFCICGGTEERTGGNIVLGEKMSLLVDALMRVLPGGRLQLVVDYSRRKTRKLGALSSQYETGGRGSITVSTGVGDAGGVSYGAYQMTSKHNGGTVTQFVQSSDFPWRAEFVGLTAGTPEFTQKWKEIVTAHKDAFVEIEHAFIQKTHYEPLVEKIKRDNNIDVTEHSDALNDVIWSTAVQMGPQNPFVGLAINNVQIPVSRSKAYNEELIKEIYSERGRKRADGKLAHFASNSQEVQDGVSARYTNELLKALKELHDENF